MKIKLETYTPEDIISSSAKTCYATEGDRNITKTLVHKNKHLAVLRFAFAVFKIDEISRACADQLVRSSHLSYLVQSMRYVKADKMKFIVPYGLSNKQKLSMERAWDNSLDTYNMLIMNGLKKEDARAVLPMNTSTAVAVAGNLQGWVDAIKLRVSPYAQKEIRIMFILIWRELSKVYPNVFPSEFKVNGKELQYWIVDEKVEGWIKDDTN